MYIIGPDLLNVLLLKPSGSKFFHFLKFDHVIELIYMCTRFVTNGSFVAQCGSHLRLHCAIWVQNHYCFQAEAFSNLLSGVQVLREWLFFLFCFFLPATQVYFMIKLVRATKHQVGLAYSLHVWNYNHLHTNMILPILCILVDEFLEITCNVMNEFQHWDILQISVIMLSLFIVYLDVNRCFEVYSSLFGYCSQAA